MIKWIKNLFCRKIYIPTYGELLTDKSVIDISEPAALIIYKYKVYLKDMGKVVVRATEMKHYTNFDSYYFFYKSTVVACFEKSSVMYIKADLPKEVLNEV